MTNNIVMPQPEWSSKLASIIIEIERARARQLRGKIPPYLFAQLGYVVGILEAVGSSRIEGNHTTLTEYITESQQSRSAEEDIREIDNIRDAQKFIEDHQVEKIDRAYISELHTRVTRDLNPRKAGSFTPGEFRKREVSIAQSKHKPPSGIQVTEYMEKFIDWINSPFDKQNYMLMVAIAHHCWTYIHPFDDGNGRVGRLLTYALLHKRDFASFLFNPSGVFYEDREKYYANLARADGLKDEDLLAWAEYVLEGLQSNMQKFSKWASKQYVVERILKPAFRHAYDRGDITEKEKKILDAFTLSGNHQMTIKSGDIGDYTAVQRSRMLAKLKQKKVIESTRKNGRIYRLVLSEGMLLPSVIYALKRQGVVSGFLENE